MEMDPYWRYPILFCRTKPKGCIFQKGQYNVVLNAKNSAGEDVEVKQKFIKIEAKILAPLPILWQINEN